ncbi:LysR family transcriptional regulator [Thiomicrospira sp. ALE5]|uniref:LysR family transcriptional regulator n=1 Tax=Thiomicrospira sp. ALE5 TaxID=748650 RepID=UPI0008E87B55|nr:LysR family transcriptional regulator [Thiomicrospira sp. ALE5]SFR58756.1 LysR family transcriptional regulator, regulator for metE and metH [Thiomicrospira sp. ALE5]
MLDIKHLKTMEALHKQGSLVKAADSMNMTQSALSHQIKLLEQHLEMELFKRKTHPLQFTPAGRLLLDSALTILPQMQQLERQLVMLIQGETGRLWIGIDCHTCFEWILPLLKPYLEKWPSVDFDIVPSFQAPPLQKLQQQQVDFVVTSDPEKIEGIDYTALFSYELVAVLPPNSELSKKDYLLPEDFSDQTLITYPVSEQKLDVFKQFLTPAGIEPQAVTYSELTLMMLQRVAASRGICVLPQWLVDNQVDFQHLPRRALGKEGLWTKLYAATPQVLTQQPYIQEFIQLIANEMDV